MGYTLLDDAPKAKYTLLEDEPGTLKNIGMGALKAASDIGSTILRPVDAALNAVGATQTTNKDRRASLGQFFGENADPHSLAFKGGELATDIAGTAGVGGALSKFPLVAQYFPKIAASLQSGGFTLGSPAATTGLARVGDMATRVAGGAAVGGASAGLINPEDAGMGAAIGGALPVVAKVAGAAGNAIAPKVSPEVQALYQKAKDLGIDIPADRLVNSRPMNAVASSLNYVPFSGRAATEEKMLSQVNRALSKTFGQDSDNVTAALRKAQTDLGDKFEITLKSNTVKADNQLVNDLTQNLSTAQRELSGDGARIISNQVDDILAKVGQNGEIDGQAAYNIKKSLDRIGNRNSPEAFYARELKKSLMGALDRSLGPTEAAAFKTTRQQYGNMLDLENLAQNGAEGGISVGRLANMKNINNQELQDLADIAAQFVKTRESPHGAMQRVMVGGTLAPAAAATGTLPALATGIAAARGVNTALNSGTVKDMLLSRNGPSKLATVPLRTLIYDAATLSNP